MLNSLQDESIGHYVDQLIQQAILLQASDIHIEPQITECKIRMRRDGLLFNVDILPTPLSLRVISRLKILAKLNISEKRLPQDGSIHLADTEIRISTCPILHGEKMVLRLFNKKQTYLDITKLGMTAAQEKIVLSAINQPQGLILVTGPTGSGKSMTLYAALNHLNTSTKNISTVEDPIEMALPGINQTTIHPQIQLSFAAILRALLRQDPDILMIGEIRDQETAQIAIQAAQTGHLVLSTLHTREAMDTIFRLQSLGILSDYLMSALTCLIAQRLVRNLCQHCKIQETEKIFRAAGCEHCHEGYIGRSGIFECVPLTPAFFELIHANASLATLSAYIQQEGHYSLWEAGLEKLLAGLTTKAELIRVLGKPPSNYPHLTS